MEFEKVLRERKSTRLFSSKEVEEEKLLQILEAARVAPTAKNAQPFKILVVRSKEGIKKVDNATRCRYKAPICLIVCADKEKAYNKKNGHSYVDIDASIVTTHMMLEATNVGVDNIWIGLFNEEIVKEEFELDDNMIPVCMLMIGYKSRLCPPNPFHNSRKSLDEIVEYR